MNRLGYQLSSFTCPGSRPEEILDCVAARAKAAEAAGCDRVMVMGP